MNRLLRFCIIGCCAALTYMLAIFILVNIYTVPKLLANVCAFLSSFFISYFGHAIYTFSYNNILSFQTLVRFFYGASIGLLVNEALFYLFTYHYNIYYMISAFFALGFSSILSFCIYNLWVFRQEN